MEKKNSLRVGEKVISKRKKGLKEVLQYGAIYGAALISLLVLIVIIGYIFIQGIPHLNLKFLTNGYDSQTVYATIEGDYLGAELEEKEGHFYIKDITDRDQFKTAVDIKGNPVSLRKGDEVVTINKDEVNINSIEETVKNSDGETLLKIKKAGKGIFPMVITTLMMIGLSLIVSVPIGIFAAIYLTEYAKQGRLIRMIRFSVECLSGIPSIIYGLFGMLFFVTVLKLNYSILAGALTVSILLLPIIIRTTEETLKTVPMSFREASLGLGGTKIQTIIKVILPSALPGILTAIILSTGRIIGESAALLLTAGTAAKIPEGFLSSGATLTVKAYLIAKEEGDIGLACAIGIIIIAIILLLNMLTKFIARRRLMAK